MSTGGQDAFENAIKRIEQCERTGATRLDLLNLELNELPREIGRLKQLTQLRLDTNSLTALPQEILELNSLTSLSLIRNRFTKLPSEISQIASLTHLFLGANRLSTLPPEIGQLRALKVLWVTSNRLSALPQEFGQLTALEELDLANNQITALPNELMALDALRVLYLHGNPGLRLPPDVLGPTRSAVLARTAAAATPRPILAYYFARQDQGQAPMQEVRLLLVGRGRAGKTSLLKALRNERPDTQEPETPGITVRRLDLNCQRGTASGHVWDFGGQEFLHGTHQIFLSERCVYALVLEGRVGNWELETDYWIRFIQSFGGTSPVIVVLNKYDDHPFSVDRFRLKERCPQIVDFVETDAFSGRGVTQLRELLAVTVNGMKHVWEGVPKKWHRVKEELTRIPASFLGYEEYQDLCTWLDVKDASQQDSLAENLHRLGIALNFRDHHRLRDTSVLKPAWVTEGIYGLLRYAQKKDCYGVLDRAWLGEALPPAEYPPEKHDFVLQLMEKFEVAFALREPGQAVDNTATAMRWLIPELLPEAQPQPFDEFLGPEATRLRFGYPGALPPGLLPRFIVRTHEMSEGYASLRWRSGVVLSWAGGRALVRLDRQLRRTEVAVVNCPPADRQALFDIIRAHLNALHGKVPVVEEVQVHHKADKWVSMIDLRMAELDNDQTLKVTIGTEPDLQRVQLQVAATLDGVESQAARMAAGPNAERRVQLFLSYAHVNERELLPLRQHLTHLSQQGYIQVWQDRDLVAGEQWETGILQMLDKAELVLLFYTTGARISKFIQEQELPRALDRADAGKCTLLWVPLERNDLNPDHALEKRLSEKQCVTRDAKLIYECEPHQIGWMQVEESIRRAATARRRFQP